ncbi:hypothetical protein FIBSPDRAFT_914718 [Athelia psychrophila]|uniref:CxC1-like cysteine cluster associated with KDZ transposases domain-containing protein n=1 Tax=Athelia psychrophila TaxID=1759441 RepID=A0A167WNR2_9AGAM|nr:hypothetical protein FIBSPDRAFT_914718 [Fibularhizoctonia sp. CBS 109695]
MGELPYPCIFWVSLPIPTVNSWVSFAHACHRMVDPDAAHEHYRTTRASQWSKWTNVVVPSLIQPYFALCRRTTNLASVDREFTALCTCNKCSSRTLNVTCVYFDRIVQIALPICSCTSAPHALLARGFICSSPTHPTLAVDIKLLEFARMQFLHMIPNTTGWCGALEDFLTSLGFKLETRDTLRRRFTACLRWYYAVVDAAENHMRAPSPPDDDDVPTTPRTRPSEYLRRRCPLCFGSSVSHDSTFAADYIACVDACFTQKRTKSHSARDPNYRDQPRSHHDSRFITEEEIKAMEREVDSIRTRRPRKAKKADENDSIEPGMSLPTSVLDECGNSFVAADEKREKASTQFFVDTGLMSLLCRHDRCLFAVNMTHNGERQHYVLALLKKLFEHLPHNATLGLLYDIACQLKRSMLNFNFLSDIFPRMIFAVSVFHAYGHQWPCQVIYHPRKCSGFGLSDGEGCERFWSALRKLIPCLRVSGYYQRLFILDLHITHLEKSSRDQLGLWLARRWKKSVVTQDRARAGVQQCGVSQDVLREQWQLQVASQTRPAPRQSKKKATQAINAILALDDSIQAEQAAIARLQDSYGSSLVDVVALQEALTRARAYLLKLQTDRHRKYVSLGVSQTTMLHKLKQSKYLLARMNALALKHRLRDRLRQRKFEMERLERSYRRTMNDIKSSKHIEGALQRRAPTIQGVAKKYNHLCTEIANMVKNNLAPAGAIIPEPIPSGGLWALDVDDSIWQDIGLEDDDVDSAPPLWLRDENVRAGIRHLHDYDRCVEEQARLRRERNGLQQWAREEWAVMCGAMAAASTNLDLQYRLKQEMTNFTRQCFLWRRDARIVPCDLGESWGPSEDDIKAAGASEFTSQVDYSAYISEPEEASSEEEAIDFDDDELYEQMETMALRDEYRGVHMSSEEDEYSSDGRNAANHSRKRRRR